MRELPSDLAPALLICGFGPFPAALVNPASLVVGSLRERGWSPNGARAAYSLIPTIWDVAPERVQEAMVDCGCAGVLMVGVAARARSFRVEMRAQNRTAKARPDASGATLGRDRIDPTGPAVARATAPVADMLRALRDQGLSAEPSSDAGGYLCNFTLYRVLNGYAGRLAAPSAGFLHVPQARELAGPDAPSSLDEIEMAVRAAAQAYADALVAARSPALA